jgi:hypothetical protein
VGAHSEAKERPPRHPRRALAPQDVARRTAAAPERG